MSLTKFKKLDSRGVAHFVAPLVITLLVAVVGTYFLVASHADSIKPPRIVSVNYTAPSSVSGHAAGKSSWCADVMLKYSVKVSSKVDAVRVDAVNSGAVSGKLYELASAGKGVWAGNITHYDVCVAKKGDRAKVQDYTTDKVTAIYGGKYEITAKGTALPNKSVKIN